MLKSWRKDDEEQKEQGYNQCFDIEDLSKADCHLQYLNLKNLGSFQVIFHKAVDLHNGWREEESNP